MHINAQVAHKPSKFLNRSEPNLRQPSNKHFQDVTTGLPDYDKRNVTKKSIFYEQGILTFLDFCPGVFGPAIVTVPLQIAGLADAVICKFRQSRIKKGKGKYNLSTPGSYGRVGKAYSSYSSAQQSLLKRTLAGNPALRATNGKPFEIHALAESNGIGSVPTRSAYKALIYTRDREIANRCYQSALKSCQDFLRRNPRFTSTHPEYKPLLACNG